MISFETKGDFTRAMRWLTDLEHAEFYKKVDGLAAKGTAALSAATPVRSGVTARSWHHKVTITKTSCKIEWLNSNVNRGVPIAVILQYGHGTGTGGFVAGQDYINPAMRPVFDQIANEVWNEVKRLG